MYKNVICEPILPVRTYSVVSESRFHINLGNYHTYGVKVTDNQHTEILHDVSACIDTATQMVSLFNQYQLSPIHLREAIENMLP